VSIGGHQSAAAKTETWLTPPYILEALGEFDLDPCAAMCQPWQTAKQQFTEWDDGLNQPWRGRVWLNPPYGAKTAWWLKRLAAHRNGIALIFARTETEMFFEHVWSAADALFFFEGRLHFHFANGQRSPTNAGGPSVLVAYGARNAAALETCGLPGKFVRLCRLIEEQPDVPVPPKPIPAL
jgi:hypothetical protein